VAVRRTLIAFGMLIALCSAAGANYCITCVEPIATYRCIPEDSEKLARFNIGDERLGRLCAKTLAKLEKHTHCEFSRDTAKPCEGIERIVSLADVERALADSGEPNAVPCRECRDGRLERGPSSEGASE
jgi:hypothetical protein